MQLKFFTLASLAGLATAQSLIEALNSSSDLSAIAGLIANQSALAAQLGNLNNVTVLAPNNAAVAAFENSSAAAAVAANPNLLSAVLSYHILTGTYANFSGNTTYIPTALQPGQYANVTGGQLVGVRNTTVISGLLDNSTIVNSTMNFTGGVIHTINRILTLPESISDTATAFGLTSFYGALNATNTLTTVDGLSDVTVFVPNNAAFQAIGSGLSNLTSLLPSILEYHIVNGTVAYSTSLKNESVPTLQGTNVTITVFNSTNVFVNGARVVLPNIPVAGGVVHVIDEVLNPNNTATPSATQTGGTPAYSGASSVSDQPFTSGQPTATTSINTGGLASSATAAATSSSSSGAAWAPKPTGAIGAAALGGLALMLQL